MNAIGIDYQRTLAVICLREGPCATAKIRSVGDGLRHLIPTAVLDEETWGSNALISSHPNRLWGKDYPTDEPWLEEKGAVLFWRGLYRRLYTYLGRMQPDSRNGYRTVISLPAAGYESADEQIRHFCQAAGLSDITTIPLTDAILCRWMTEQAHSESDERVVAVTAIGDTSSSVRAYRIQYRGAKYPGILSASQIVSLSEIGQAWWIQNILTLLEEHINQALPFEEELGLRDAAIELGMRLGRVAPSQPVAWIGPLQKSLFTPLEVTRQECASWPEVTRLARALPVAIRDAVLPIAERATPDILLLGAVGAAWPFAKDIARGLVSEEQIWQSLTPQEDGAWGAACWPEVGESYTDVFQGHTVPAPEKPEPDRVHAPAPATNTKSSYEEIMKLVNQYSDESQPAVDVFPFEDTREDEDQYPLEHHSKFDPLDEEALADNDLQSDVFPPPEQYR